MKKLLLFLVAIFGCLSLCAQQSTYYTKENYVFSVSKENLNKAIKYASQKDDAAFNMMIKEGKVSILKKNAEVYVVEQTLSLVKIRPKGQTVEVWTVREAISKTKQH